MYYYKYFYIILFFSQTLALIDTDAKHDAASITDMVETTMRKYNIVKDQVMACVVDNASNMVKAVTDLNADEEESEEDEDGFDVNLTQEHYIDLIRCGAHTMQLAVRDGLKHPTSSALLGRIHEVCNLLRAPKINSILKRRTGKGMVTEVPTRWSSTYEALNRLLELKEAVEDLAGPQTHLNEDEWAGVADLRKILAIPYQATLRMQRETMTPGEFLKEWRHAYFKLEQVEGNLAAAMRAALLRRESRLLESRMILAAVFADARYRTLLTLDQIAVGRETFKVTFAQLHKLKNLSPPHSPDKKRLKIAQRPATDSDDEFEVHLDQLADASNVSF